MLVVPSKTPTLELFEGEGGEIRIWFVHALELFAVKNPALAVIGIFWGHRSVIFLGNYGMHTLKGRSFKLSPLFDIALLGNGFPDHLNETKEGYAEHVGQKGQISKHCRGVPGILLSPKRLF